MQTDDVGVVNALEDENLGHEAFPELLVEAERCDLLDGHLGAVDLVTTVPHRRERTRTDLLPHDVVPHHSAAPPRRLSHSPPIPKKQNPRR